MAPLPHMLSTVFNTASYSSNHDISTSVSLRRQARRSHMIQRYQRRVPIAHRTPLLRDLPLRFGDIDDSEGSVIMRFILDEDAPIECFWVFVTVGGFDLV